MNERLDDELRALRAKLETDKKIAVDSMNFEEAAEIRAAIKLLDALLGASS